MLGSNSEALVNLILRCLARIRPGFWQNLHEPDGVGVGDDVGLKGGFLSNESAANIGSKSLRSASRRRTVSYGSGNKTFQTLGGTSLNLRESKLGTARRP